MENILFGLILVCIVSEILVVIFKDYAFNLKYSLLAGSIPILLYSVYHLRFLMDGIQGL